MITIISWFASALKEMAEFERTIVVIGDVCVWFDLANDDVPVSLRVPTGVERSERRAKVVRLQGA